MSEEVGMYAVFNDEYPKVRVGEFTICRQDSNSVWIQKEDGEGGQFSDISFEDMIRKYLKDNF